MKALENGAYYQLYEGSALAFESLSLTTNFTCREELSGTSTAAGITTRSPR